jgi:hypothetical protein
MKLNEYVQSKGCRIEETTDDIQRVHEGRAPRYEVFAPEGKRFDSGLHSLLCADAKDVRDRLENEQLEDCPKDCDCKDSL